MFSYTAQKKGLEFIYESTTALPEYVYGDDIRLRQVLTNICGNAVKYTEKGQVKLKLSAADTMITFEISDTGMGIRKEDIPKLFDSFERFNTQKTRSIIGTGLGLPISKSCVDMMGGTIQVDSEYGHGSVFTIMVPLVAGKKTEVQYKKAGFKEYNIHAPDAAVLIVDDNEFNLRVAQGLLGLFGIIAKTVASGMDAIDMVKKETFDIVFMDHMMPDMDGVEATAAIRTLGSEFETLPIIALTANAVHGMKEMFLSHGFNDFIAKPINVDELEAALEKWLPAQKISRVETTRTIPESEPAAAQDGLIHALNQISEINTEIGLGRVSGAEEMYRKTLELFHRKITTECDYMTASLTANNLKSFTISVHAMKSTLAILGVMQLSEAAAKLEEASRQNDYAYCAERYPELREKLLALHQRLTPILQDIAETIVKKPGDMAYLRDNLPKALEAAEFYEQSKGSRIISDLATYDFGNSNNELLEKVAEAFGDYEYDEAKKYLDALAQAIGE
jgi:CheY-like chemotaxis protein/HPt (histidine-containing phosphotransfer) domain-containing protein/anti-sigma regulatory factor (Ser/Thr protein kinase)